MVLAQNRKDRLRLGLAAFDYLAACFLVPLLFFSNYRSDITAPSCKSCSSWIRLASRASVAIDRSVLFARFIIAVGVGFVLVVLAGLTSGATPIGSMTD